MASEILYAGLADQRLAEVLTGQYLLSLASREALPNHPALMYAGDAAGRGSIVLKMPVVGLNGYDLPSAVADGASVANTALTDSSITVTPARYSKAYEISDLSRITDQGLLSPGAFAADAVATGATYLLNLIANVTDGFSATQGVSGSDLTIAQFQAAKIALTIANVEGPYIALLHPQQVGDLETALLTASGPIQWMPASAAQLQLIGTGARGQFLGVDIYSSGHVPTANSGADRAGAMFGRGAVVWADASIPAEGDPNQLIVGNKVLLERVRTGRAGLTAHVMHQYLGASLGINACGVSIITDA